MKNSVSITASAILTALLAGCATPAPTEAPPAPAHLADSVSYQRMADGIHAVLRAANAAWLQDGGRSAATPTSPSDLGFRASDLEKKGTRGARPSNGNEIDSHAAFLRQTAQEIATHGAEFSFALRSPWPIRPLGAAQTALEEEALALLQQAPDQPVFRDEQLGGRAYFTAVYPERATSASCVDCHNQNVASPRRDFAEGDLMGALVIRIPREF